MVEWLATRIQAWYHGQKARLLFKRAVAGGYTPSLYATGSTSLSRPVSAASSTASILSIAGGQSKSSRRRARLRGGEVDEAEQALAMYLVPEAD